MNKVIYIMGVAGSGKTTIGKMLSIKTGIPFFDADDFHPIANKEKMKSGYPLNDEDRALWLQQLNTLAVKHANLNGAIIACSALKEKYRAVLSASVPQTAWIFLQGTYEVVYGRMKERDHFMPTALLQSQFDTLEFPLRAFVVDIKNEPAAIVESIFRHLQESN